MNNQIEIYTDQPQGTARIWFNDEEGKQQCITLKETDVNWFLDKSQKEDFFLADRTKYKFSIANYEYKQLQAYIKERNTTGSAQFWFEQYKIKA